MKTKRLALIGFAAALLISGLTAFAANEFPLKDGDTWVFAGDSITAQRMHTNYIEGYCAARFPAWNLHFRNSGVGGDTIPRVLARFDYDVAAWKPTIISVELGMNDSGAGPGSVDTYMKGMDTLVHKISAAGARPVIISSSPVNDGTTTGKLADRNVTIDKYSTALRDFTVKNSIPYADQFHALLDAWGKNKPFENIVRFSDAVSIILKNPSLPDADLLRKWQAQWQANPLSRQSVNLTGDAIHPGPTGQVTMCAAILKELGAPSLVSRAVLDASGKVVEVEKCTVTNAATANGTLTFDRLDQALPMPLPEGTADALVLCPFIANLNQWMLTVRNLPAGSYTVTIDGQNAGTVTAADLAKGWNMAFVDGPVLAQGRQILALIAAKEGLVTQWRGKSAVVARNPADKPALDAITAQVLEADKKIKETAQPRTHKFVLTPVKP